MISPYIMACLITFHDIIIILGWFASATAGFLYARYLDRQRSINAVISKIEMIKDVVISTEDRVTAFEGTLNDLKESVFTAIPLFLPGKQKHIIEAWRKYRAMNIGDIQDDPFISSVREQRGHKVERRHEAIISGLDRIRSAIKQF